MRTGRQHPPGAGATRRSATVFVRLAGPRRRSGAVLIEDEDERLLGHLHRQRPRPALRDAPRGRPRPADRRGDDRRPGADRASARRSPRRSRRCKARKISELPVVDRGGRLVGLIDLTDLIGLVPADCRGVTGDAHAAAADDLAARCAPIELLRGGRRRRPDRRRDRDRRPRGRDQALPRPRRQRAHPLAEGGQAGGDPLGPLGAGGRPPRGRAGDRAGDPGGRRQGGAVPAT